MFYPIGNTKAASVFHATPEDHFEVGILLFIELIRMLTMSPSFHNAA